MSILIESIKPELELDSIQNKNTSLFPFLLQSVALGHNTSRYDILFACPQETLCLNSTFKLQKTESLNLKSNSGFLTALDEWWKENQTDIDDKINLPFQGGWFLYLSYELLGEIEASVNLNIESKSAQPLPIAFAVRIPAAIIKDKVLNKCYLMIEKQFHTLAERINPYINNNGGQAIQKNNTLSVQLAESNENNYLESVDTIKQYIRDGDVFQVNLSRLWQGEIDASINANKIYKQLCEHNPAPFAGLVYWQDSAIICSSPERLLSVRNRKIQTRPIAGTYPRSETIEVDKMNSNELLIDPKECAEHIMLVDLERNDMGRVCVPGSIKVEALMTLESYAHVHHLVSKITGKLKSTVSPGEVIRALFPGGTITGCPKIRCMQILAELERGQRGAYTGSFGYLNRSGDMDLNILIRTMLLNKQTLSFRAGGGIVFDSSPKKELAETRMKAKGMLNALGLETE